MFEDPYSVRSSTVPESLALAVSDHDGAGGCPRGLARFVDLVRTLGVRPWQNKILYGRLAMPWLLLYCTSVADHLTDPDQAGPGTEHDPLHHG